MKRARRMAAGVPAGSLELCIDGVRVAVVRQGRGAPVVCLHAIGHGARDYEAFSALVSDQFEVIRIDWPNHGRSGPDHQSASSRRYAQLLGGIVEQLGLIEPILIGCSIGGAAAIEYASRRNVAALVLANSAGLHSIDDRARRTCLAISEVFTAGALGAWWFGSLFWLYCRMVLPTPAAAQQRRRIARGGYETAAAVSEAWRSFPRSESDLRAVFSTLDVPVMAAWAMGDRINRFHLAKPALESHPHIKIRLFEGGHAAFLEQPRCFVQEFTEFVRSVLPPPARRGDAHLKPMGGGHV